MLETWLTALFPVAFCCTETWRRSSPCQGPLEKQPKKNVTYFWEENMLLFWFWLFRKREKCFWMLFGSGYSCWLGWFLFLFFSLHMSLIEKNKQPPCMWGKDLEWVGGLSFGESDLGICFLIFFNHLWLKIFTHSISWIAFGLVVYKWVSISAPLTWLHVEFCFCTV